MSRADADVVIKLDVRDGKANASLTAFEARLKRLESSGKSIGSNFDDLTGKIDEMSDAMSHFDKKVTDLDKKSLKSLDKELVNKKRDFDNMGKSVNKSTKEMDKSSRSADKAGDALKKAGDKSEAFSKSMKAMMKFAKFAGIEFLALSAAVGAMTIALKGGQLVLKGWQYVLKGVGIAAGGALAAVSTVLAAMREYQFAMMMPALKSVGTPMTGATDARSRVSMFMGASSGLGSFSDKAVQQALTSAMGNGQKVNPQLFSMMRTLGNFTVGTNSEKSLPAIMAAFTAAQKNKGKFTSESYGDMAQQAPGIAKVFEEMAGGPKNVEAALKSGKITVDSFMQAFKDGQLESIKPFLGALDEVDKTLVGRFKTNIKGLRETLVSLGMPLVDALKGPLEGLNRDVEIFIAKVGPNVQSTFEKLLGGSGGGIDRMFSRLATLVNENIPKVLTWGASIRDAINWTKDLFSTIGDYLQQFSGTGSSLWTKIFKPLGKEILGTIDYAMKTFGKTMDDNAPFADRFAQNIHEIFEAVRSLIDGFAKLKSAMAPILDTFMRLLGVLGDIMKVMPGGELMGALGLGAMMMRPGKLGKKSMASDMRDMKNMMAGGGAAGGMGAGRGKGGGGLLYGGLSFMSMGMLGGLSSSSGQLPGAGFRASRLADRKAAFDASYQSGMESIANKQRGAAIARLKARQEQLMYGRDDLVFNNGLRKDPTLGAYFQKNSPGYYTTGSGQLVPMDVAQKAGVQFVGGKAHSIGGQMIMPGDEDAALSRYAMSRDAYVAKYGTTERQLQQSAQAGMPKGNRMRYEDRLNAALDRGEEGVLVNAKKAGEAQAKAFTRKSAKEWAQTSGKELLKTAGPAAAGMALSYIGGTIASRVDGANQAGQAAAGAISMAGQGAMMGAMFGPAGALIGGGAGALIGGVTGWMNAGKEKKRRIAAAEDAGRQYGLSFLVQNERASFGVQKDETNALRERILGFDALKNKQALGEKAINEMFGNNSQATYGNETDTSKIRELYRTTGMDFNSFIRGTENIFGDFNQGDTNKKLEELLAANQQGTLNEGLTAQEVSSIQTYLDTMKEISVIEEQVGKTSYERLAFLSKLDDSTSEVVGREKRFNSNLVILSETLGMAEEDAIRFAQSMNMDLSGAFVNVETVMDGLGYTADAFANRATAAGRLLDRVLSTTDSRRSMIEGDMAFDAVGQTLFNTPAGKFESPERAQMAAVEFLDQAMINMTTQRTTKGTAMYNMSAKDYAAEVERQLGGYYTELVNRGGDPAAIAEYETLLYGAGGKNGRLIDTGDAAGRYARNNFTPGGILGEVQSSYTTLSGRLATDEKFALDIGQAVTQAAADAMSNNTTGKSVTVLADEALQTVLASPAFKDSGLTEADAKAGLQGMILGEMDEGVASMAGAFTAGATELQKALAGTVLGVNGIVTGSVAVSSGGDTATVKFGFTGTSTSTNRQYGGMPGSSGQGTADDTTTSRWGRTLGAHNRFDSMLPGRRNITSGVRNYNLGSPSSDHRFGRAFDLTGDNLGQYAQNVNDSGGFAEFHGAAGGRHLHVVPPVGDASSPYAGGTAAGGNTNYYNVTVNAGSNASADDIANVVITKIKSIQRSDMERV